VEAFWDEAEANLPGGELQIPAYREALLARFGNARIAHNLAQIAMDGSTKLRMRAVPVLQAERTAGRTGAAAAFMIAAWMDFSVAATFRDPLGEEVAAANSLSGTDRVKALLAVVDPLLASDAGVVGLVESLCGAVAGAPLPSDR
jgi:fructuronate reductase